jgi:hypothetical protein
MIPVTHEYPWPKSVDGGFHRLSSLVYIIINTTKKFVILISTPTSRSANAIMVKGKTTRTGRISIASEATANAIQSLLPKKRKKQVIESDDEHSATSVSTISRFLKTDLN